MILFKKIPFTFQEKEYEIRIYYNDILINVVVFHNNYPATGFRHQVEIPKKETMKELLEQDVIDELGEIAKSDIFEKRWERLLRS